MRPGLVSRAFPLVPSTKPQTPAELPYLTSNSSSVFCGSPNLHPWLPARYHCLHRVYMRPSEPRGSETEPETDYAWNVEAQCRALLLRGSGAFPGSQSH